MTRQQHCLAARPLDQAHSAQASASGQVVYVVCGWQGCPQRRLVRVDEWQAIVARRQAAEERR